MGSTPGDHELVEAAIGDAHETATGWLRANCPFCLVKVGKTDRNRSLSIEPGDWFYRCWRCGTKGKLRAAPDGHTHRLSPDRGSAAPALDAPEDFMLIDQEPARSSQAVAPARRYLYAKRGVSEQTAREAAIGVCLSGRAAGRIIVPVFAVDGESWRGWVGRAWGSTPNRYMYPPGMPRGEVLFNEAALYVETEEPLLLVEGAYDVLPHWPDAVAFLGKPTGEQFELLKKARRPLVSALDGDAWGEAEALAMRLNLEEVRCGWIHLPPVRDPGNFRREVIRQMAREACA